MQLSPDGALVALANTYANQVRVLREPCPNHLFRFSFLPQTAWGMALLSAAVFQEMWMARRPQLRLPTPRGSLGASASPRPTVR